MVYLCIFIKNKYLLSKIEKFCKLQSSFFLKEDEKFLKEF